MLSEACGQDWMKLHLNTDQILISRDSFVMVNHDGIKVGSMVMDGHFQNTHYIWKEISILDSIMSERSTYTFNASKFTLKESSLVFNQGKTNIVGVLKWNMGHVTGTYEINQKSVKQTVDIDTIFSGLVDRAEVFAFIHAIPLRVGLRFPVNVLVQPSGEIWNMQIEVIAEVKCIVPAGEFDTFKINFYGGKVSNMLYVSKGPDPKLVKVEVVGQPLHIELVSSYKK